MNLLAQLLLTLPAQLPPVARPVRKRPDREISRGVFEPIMRGKGPMSNDELRALTGKGRCAVNSSMSATLIPKGYVKRIPRRRGKTVTYDYEWVGK